jgi:hypothetical protein
MSHGSRPPFRNSGPAVGLDFAARLADWRTKNPVVAARCDNCGARKAAHAQEKLCCYECPNPVLSQVPKQDGMPLGEECCGENCPPCVDGAVEGDALVGHALVMAGMLLARIRDSRGAVQFFEASAVTGMIEKCLANRRTAQWPKSDGPEA